jgi:membrane dipeptidase
MALSDEQRAAGVSFLKRHVSADIHCHPGRFFLSGLPPGAPAIHALGEPFEERAISELQAGNVSAGLFAAVSDLRLLEVTPAGIHSNRDFQAGEALADYQRQLAELKAFAAKRGLGKGLSTADVDQAHRHHETAAVFAIEGGDFIEDRLDRVHTAFADGVRAITIVHYHVNQIGDIQTQPPVHGGLTPLGKSIVGELNRAGIIIDLAHATLEVVRSAVETSTKPVMISHSNLATPTANHPRLISAEHAKLVTAGGGIIGAWPSGFGQATFADFIDSIQRLIDTVGIDHVAIGTDMDANYKPVLRSYRAWSLIPAALLARGLHETEVAKVLGTNFLRVFGANLARR